MLGNQRNPQILRGFSHRPTQSKKVTYLSPGTKTNLFQVTPSNIVINTTANWSDEQALAIFDFLDKLRDKVWFEYQEGIIRQLRTETGGTERDIEISESFEFDDDINF